MGSARAHDLASTRRRDAAFAACLALVLTAGVLGVLLLNTSMQQQALAVARSHARLAALSEQLQTLRARLDWTSDPAVLAERAHRLRLKPVKQVSYVRLSEARAQARTATRTGGRVSAPRPGAGRAHAG